MLSDNAIAIANAKTAIVIVIANAKTTIVIVIAIAIAKTAIVIVIAIADSPSQRLWLEASTLSNRGEMRQHLPTD